MIYLSEIIGGSKVWIIFIFIGLFSCDNQDRFIQKKVEIFEGDNHIERLDSLTKGPSPIFIEIMKMDKSYQFKFREKFYNWNSKFFTDFDPKRKSYFLKDISQIKFSINPATDTLKKPPNQAWLTYIKSESKMKNGYNARISIIEWQFLDHHDALNAISYTGLRIPSNNCLHCKDRFWVYKNRIYLFQTEASGFQKEMDRIYRLFKAVVIKGS